MRVSSMTGMIRAAACLLPIALSGAPAWGQATSLNDALARAYLTNPGIAAARAQLRATDESVPTARSGWRPTVTLGGSTGYAYNTLRQLVLKRPVHAGGEAVANSENAQLTQPVFNGGATIAAVRQAENQVRAQRAQLQLTEQTLFTDVLSAYVAVTSYRRLLALSIENEQVLGAELTGAKVRFKVGDVTLTDVAQAEAALANANALRQTAERDLQTANSRYRRYVGEEPGPLFEPQPLRLPFRNLDQARILAEANNPSVVAAEFTAAAARDQIDGRFAALLPTSTITVAPTRSVNTSLPGLRTVDTQVLGNVNANVYQGGAEYAAIRQARQSAQQTERQVTEARRAAAAQLVSAWESYAAARASAESTRAQIRASDVAFEGVRREMIAGNRTTLDLLNAQQATLSARQALVRANVDQVNTSYAVAAAVGRFTARDLGLRVPLYDDTAYYKAVESAWAGTGDPVRRKR